MAKLSSQLVHRVILRLDRLRTFIMDTLSLSPKDFAWKVRWRMRYDRNPVFIEIQDKYKVKAYAQKWGVRSAETYFVTDDPETIPFDSLPESYVIKANHGCGWNIFCTGGELYLYQDDNPNSPSKIKLSRKECIHLCNYWLKSTYSRKQWAYRHIVPKILVEETLMQFGGGALIDYRCYSFRGKVRVIQIDAAVYRNNESIFFDPNWRELRLSIYRNRIPGPVPEKPNNLHEIISAAEKLGKGLDFVRVDLYNTAHGVILGEMTLYPEAGMLNRPTADTVFNKWLGDEWILPSLN